MAVDVPCKLTAGSIVSVSDAFSVFAFMTMVFYSENKQQTSCQRPFSTKRRLTRKLEREFLQEHVGIEQGKSLKRKI